jgi:hypothetical protein
MTIPSDELFWPSEPDFIPPVQLDRLPRRASLEMPGKTPLNVVSGTYWLDPREEYALQWRERISSALDEVMEKVP